MRSTAIAGLCVAGVSALALVTVSAQQKPDPRVGLKPGLHDAGEAAWNLERVVNLPKPDGFFDPKAPGGNPAPPEPDPKAPPDPKKPDPDAPPPFDPVVWDRRRFEVFWNWRYRFEAYTPPALRQLGYYALPLLYGYDVVGWANVSLAGGRIDAKLGFIGGPPKEPAFRRGLDAELAAMESFLGDP